MPMALKAPRSGDGVPGGSVASWLEFDLDGAGVIQVPDDVGTTRGRARKVSRRDVRWRAVSDLACPPAAVTCLVPDVYTGGEVGIAQTAKPKVAGDQGVAGREEELALRSGGSRCAAPMRIWR